MEYYVTSMLRKAKALEGCVESLESLCVYSTFLNAHTVRGI